LKAVILHGAGDIRPDNINEPSIRPGFDTIVTFNASAICDTDLHFVLGTVPGTQEGTVLGHEASLPQPLPESSYCRAGYYAQCDNANPNAAAPGE